MTSPVALSADLIESFSGTFLSHRYDNRVPTAQFHRDAWALYASPCPRAMVIAPREHAKSTALTMCYIMAEVMFRTSDYVVLLGSTEEFAAEQLGNITEEIRENDDLRREFRIKGLESDTKTDIVVVFQDGARFRVLCRGSEQRIRGRLWNGKRPNLLVGDDLEDDEQVENADRRNKFSRWLFRAALQALGRYGKARLHGTILHEGSQLNKLRQNKSWKHLYYKAHEGFDDFSSILWPENWPEERLRIRRQEFIDAMDAGGYSQEFLNDPLDNSEAYLRRSDFLPMEAADYDSDKTICAAADFAVSKADKANRTSFAIGGKDLDNKLHYLDQRVGRWDTVEWMDELFLIQQRWNPEIFFVEDGVIWKAVKRMVYEAMREKDIFINIQEVPSVKDKATRGRPFQRRMRAGHCRFDKKADWYPGYEQELLRFTGMAAATLDDQFDSSALLAKGLDDMRVEKEDFYDEEELELERGFWNSRRGSPSDGRSMVTGY
tara:strand:+ start:379 stop:1854 length:1476 start_codon:yes stop_codon:yes gene_type:complete